MRKALRISSGIFAAAGLLVMLGTAGALDTMAIDLTRAMVQTVGGLVAVGVGAVGMVVC